MSRIQRVIRGLFSSYLLLMATGVYSLVSVPLALHYLDTTRFGLWILMGTLSTYIALIDLGMMNAGCRLFIDHKDQKDGGEYAVAQQ
jgi:O-antigen/teichoic acid export membrane protein